MTSSTKRWQIGVTVLVMVAYLVGLLRNLDESRRRSLQLAEAPVSGDDVSVSLRVVAVNPGSSEMRTRVSFRVDGDLAKDPVTPAVDLKLFLNDIRGPQEIEFPRGRRMNPIEAVFALDGNVNQYPFDRYETSIRMMVAKRARIAPAAQPLAKEAGNKARLPGDTDSGLLVGSSALQQGESVPIVSSIAASIPGLKFEGNSVDRPGQGIEGFNLVVRRADNVVVVSVFTMVLMMSLAMGVFLMSMHALISAEKLDLLPLSLSITLLFGLPALRDAQPGVPALGAFGDYLSYLWAEQIVAVAAIIIIWTWLTRRRRAKQED